MILENDKIKLEKVTDDNLEILINWTLDPIAQGKYKVVPKMSREELAFLFTTDENREYFLIRTKSGTPIGRFYFRKWFFNSDETLIDWELNIIIADPLYRGLGLGTAVQKLGIKILEERKETNSIFAFTRKDNIGERRALEKCGLDFVGNLNNSYYKIGSGELKPSDFVLYTNSITYR